MAAQDWVVSTLTFLYPTGCESSGTYVVGKFWHDNVVTHEGVFDRRRIAVPGQNGFKIKKFGSRGRAIDGGVFYIASTYAGLYTAHNADRTVLENALFSVTPPHRSAYTNCELVSFPEGEIYTLRDGSYFMKTRLAVFCTE